MQGLLRDEHGRVTGVDTPQGRFHAGVVVSAQNIWATELARWTGIAFHGSAEYAGYLMASSSFFAFAYALNRGAHIRVNLFLTTLGRHRFWGELWCMTIGLATTSYLAWYAVKAVYWSRKLNDISQGQDATPLWIPQLPMAFGAILLAVCFADNLITLLVVRRDNIRHATLDQPAE